LIRARTFARAGFVLSVAALAAAHAPAIAQERLTRQSRIYEYRVPDTGPRFGQREAPPLGPLVQARLERARGLAVAGKLDAARDSLTALLALAPHHPAILLELGSVLEQRRAWRPLEHLARSERAAARDSLLLAQDLVTALRRLGKPREAAQVVLEAWIASPVHQGWARTTLDTLLSAEPKGVRELVRRAATALPMRLDLVRVTAEMEWSLGDTQAALRLLDQADAATKGVPLRWAFAEELLTRNSARDSAGAIEALMDLASDRGRNVNERLGAARRAWDVCLRRGGARASAPRVAHALEDVPPALWGKPLTIEVIRGLREAGTTDDARRLLRALGDQSRGIPEIAIERALNDLRDGPPERALEALRSVAGGSPEATFRYAEALFFAGQADSALGWYAKATEDPASPFAGAALERMYLVEDASPKSALGLFGRLAYEEWRGDQKRALILADSLYRTLPHASLWAVTALRLAALREASGDGKAALEPLLAVAEGLPDDRLAPLARQRAGDAYRVWYRDDGKALQQYEECLSRYPKAWNAPEVRRWVETIRRERRF
jgi:tetratricopeptide (TPR) repeat protein